MQLKELLLSAWDKLATKATKPYTYHGKEDLDREVEALCNDSRKATRGAIFFAIRGTNSDGHSYIPQVIEQGTEVIVLESLPTELHPEVTYIQVSDSQEAMGLIASAFYGHPSRAMKVVGVTGTNGKTTIATLLYRLLGELGEKVGLLSTVCNYIGSEAVPSTHTTPGAIELQALLARMLEAGCSYTFMEVSSHAVAQRRIAGIDFDGAIFTNLTRDHLDYHSTVLEYLNAKKGFFDGLKPEAFALTNLDEKNGPVMLQNCRARHRSYALHSLADYKARLLSQHPDSSDLELDGREVSVRLVGEFNVYNLLAVYGATLELGLDKEAVLTVLSQLKSVDGRLETFRSDAKGFTAFVDYAHTPDALVNVLETIRNIRNKSTRSKEERIITVVGCGGDRDKGKRPIMASESGRLSDYLILTSDNPRSEKPEDILEDMKQGLSAEALERTAIIVDRAEAIRHASEIARSGDYILIAGKGHEDYQEIQGIKHHFDDREVIKALL